VNYAYVRGKKGTRKEVNRQCRLTFDWLGKGEGSLVRREGFRTKGMGTWEEPKVFKQMLKVLQGKTLVREGNDK